MQPIGVNIYKKTYQTNVKVKNIPYFLQNIFYLVHNNPKWRTRC